MSDFAGIASAAIALSVESGEIGAQPDPVILGPVVFDAFEVPEVIPWGGSQSIAIHKLPGGERIIDAMGRDDAPLSWSGIFLGPQAISRARLLDALRIAGDVLTLTWGGLSYQVVIREFRPDYKKFSHLPYRITCEVLVDNSNGYISSSYSSTDMVQQDTGTAQAEVPDDAPQTLTTTAKTETPPIYYSDKALDFTPAPSPAIPPTTFLGGADPAPAPFTVDLGPTAAPSGVGPAASLTSATSASTAEANAAASGALVPGGTTAGLPF